MSFVILGATAEKDRLERRMVRLAVERGRETWRNIVPIDGMEGLVWVGWCGGKLIGWLVRKRWMDDNARGVEESSQVGR